jgi:hypothetical protein
VFGGIARFPWRSVPDYVTGRAKCEETIGVVRPRVPTLTTGVHCEGRSWQSTQRTRRPSLPRRVPRDTAKRYATTFRKRQSGSRQIRPLCRYRPGQVIIFVSRQKIATATAVIRMFSVCDTTKGRAALMTIVGQSRPVFSEERSESLYQFCTAKPGEVEFLDFLTLCFL